MTDDLRDVFGFAEAWRKDPAFPRKIFSGMPEGLIPLLCPVCEQRFGIPRSADPRFPADLALVIYVCSDCGEHDAAEEIDQIWLDAQGYPVVPEPPVQ